jgi:hypothetical protein
MTAVSSLDLRFSLLASASGAVALGKASFDAFVLVRVAWRVRLAMAEE